jgi:hypothetical protein
MLAIIKIQTSQGFLEKKKTPTRTCSPHQCCPNKAIENQHMILHTMLIAWLTKKLHGAWRQRTTRRELVGWLAVTLLRTEAATVVFHGQLKYGRENNT